MAREAHSHFNILWFYDFFLCLDVRSGQLFGFAFLDSCLSCIVPWYFILFYASNVPPAGSTLGPQVFPGRLSQKLHHHSPSAPVTFPICFLCSANTVMMVVVFWALGYFVLSFLSLGKRQREEWMLEGHFLSPSRWLVPPLRSFPWQTASHLESKLIICPVQTPILKLSVAARVWFCCALSLDKFSYLPWR